MLKYYLLAIVIVGLALLYAYTEDPCNKLFRSDFASQHPDYRVLESDAEQGSPESVRCRVAYQKPDSAAIFEDVWLYTHEKKTGWRFSKVVGTRTRDEKP